MGMTRRKFIRGAIAAGALPTIVPSSVFGANAPSNRITVGGIGIGGVGRWQLPMIREAGFEIVALCDVDSVYAQKCYDKFPEARRYRDSLPSRPGWDHAVETAVVEVYGNIGYSRHTFVQDGLTTQGFVGGGLGVGYKLRYKLFRMDIRLEAQYTGNHLTGNLTLLDPITSPAQSMVYRTQMHNIVEQQHVLSAAIPIMFGMESDKVYCLLGVRLSLPVWTEYHISADITRSAADYRLIDDFSSMPWHQLYSNSTSESGEMKLRFNPQIICEVGWNLDHLIQPRRAHYELGLFGQVGVRDFRQPSALSHEPSAIYHQPSSTLIPWMVGLRFGIYYELGRKTKAKSSTNPLTNNQLPISQLPISNNQSSIDSIPTMEEPEVESPAPIDTAVYQGQIVTTGQKIILQNVYFATDKTDVLPSSQPGLNDLYQMLHEYPYIRVKIVGHTDNTNTAEYNQRLSEGRAASVRKSMLKRGIEAWRLETEGKGLTEPIDTNDTPEGRQHNRRVEFIIIE